MFFHREYLEEALPRFKGVTGTIWTKARDAKSAEALATLIDAQYENSPYPTKTESEKAFQMGFVSMLGNVKLLVIAISVVIVIVIVLIAANTMAMAARERVTEIAVLRTLGFQKNTILALVLSESLLISVIGGLAGTAFFVAMQPALKRALASSPMAGLAGSLRPEPEILGLGLLVALGVGVVAGIIPAIRSAQRPITDGLRQVA